MDNQVKDTCLMGQSCYLLLTLGLVSLYHSGMGQQSNGGCQQRRPLRGERESLPFGYVIAKCCTAEFGSLSLTMVGGRDGTGQDGALTYGAGSHVGRGPSPDTWVDCWAVLSSQGTQLSWAAWDWPSRGQEKDVGTRRRI